MAHSKVRHVLIERQPDQPYRILRSDAKNPFTQCTQATPTLSPRLWNIKSSHNVNWSDGFQFQIGYITLRVQAPI
jgi:hypothetical protein